MHGRHKELQNIKWYKKTRGTAAKYCFEILSNNDIFEISRVLEMKIESVAFKVYTNIG
jgi:hypothetical protein